tara:strand:+ start:354 stop:1202 length:849 start_codon:yes stop_codon:yes gene_type:complete
MIFWIASYPKSGNTWLRALLSSYYYSDDGFFKQNLLEKIGQFPEKRHFNHFNYNPKIVTDTSRFWIDAQNKINKDKKIKFFKTHNILGSINNHKFTNKENTLGGIYIVRDPRNILTSIQNHYELTKDDALKFIMNEKKFIHDHRLEDDYSDFQFISSWEKNYQSWIRQKIFPVKIIKYENLNIKTFETFKEIINFIEKIAKTKNKLDITKAKNSINSTTFSKMKNIEEKSGFVESVLSKNNPKKIPFFYLGPKNDWRNIFKNDFKKKLETTFESNLKELNYI